MNIKEILKGLVFKKPKHGLPDSSTKNPYLNARRQWNDLMMPLLSSLQLWQFLGIAGLLIALAAVAGIIHIGSQSKFIPYIVEVDRLGQASAAGPAIAARQTDPRVIHACVAEFITDARCVTPDVALQRKAIFRTYAKLMPNDPATTKMNEWLNATEECSPFKRAAKEMVSAEIKSVLAQTPDTWQVDWVETTRDRQGVIKDAKGKPVNWRALVTVDVAGTKQGTTTEEQIRNNPLGIYVRDFTWSRLTN